jgi:hypothetical protein
VLDSKQENGKNSNIPEIPEKKRGQPSSDRGRASAGDFLHDTHPPKRISLHPVIISGITGILEYYYYYYY